MSFDKSLELAASIAAILTAMFAAGASIWYFGQRCARKWALERYLIRQRQAGTDAGARSIVHLMGNCSMTEAQVLEAAFGNKKIKTWITVDDETNRANGLMFQINDEAWRRLRKSN